MDINTVTVIGATGTMGANITGIFASFGNAKVYVLSRNLEKVKKTIPKIIQSVRADAIISNIMPADFSMLEHCIKKSDLVFESAAEEMNTKKAVHLEIAKYLRDDAIVCTGTSGLSVVELAECYPQNLKKNFFGVHMFNPPYSMSLCELIRTPFSDEKILDDLHSYLEKKLYRTVVEIKDAPAFLANRIGFYTINGALRAAEEYKDSGGVDYIDAILGPFTGRLMAPITTADFVGLDVHKAIVDNIYNNLHDYASSEFLLPDYVKKLISEGCLGRKSSGGLYKMIKNENGTRRLTVWDIDTNQYREPFQYQFPFAEEMKAYIEEGDYEDALKALISNTSQEAKICVEFLLKYIVYAVFSADEIGDSVADADDVMATGFNWCPPMALYEALSSITDVNVLIHERIPEIVKSINWDCLSKQICPSKYDYRLYFRSK